MAGTQAPAEAPAPTWGRPGFKPPQDRQEFVFEDAQSVPEWVDKGWMGWDGGIVINVPQGDPLKSPYTTKVARRGDTVVYVPGNNGAFGKFEVITPPAGVPQDFDYEANFRPKAWSEADLEDLIKTGATTLDEMDPDARSQVLYRRAGVRPLHLVDEFNQGDYPASQ